MSNQLDAPFQQANLVETFDMLREEIGKYWTDEAIEECFGLDPFDANAERERHLSNVTD